MEDLRLEVCVQIEFCWSNDEEVLVVNDRRRTACFSCVTKVLEEIVGYPAWLDGEPNGVRADADAGELLCYEGFSEERERVT